jgi:hypothetical protein
LVLGIGQDRFGILIESFQVKSPTLLMFVLPLLKQKPRQICRGKKSLLRERS